MGEQYSVHGRIGPGLLIASPQLHDPNFRRSVVLLVEHGDSGSFGLVINRPGRLLVSSVLTALDIGWKGDPEATVGFGGPVMAETAFLLHAPLEETAPEPGTVLVGTDIAVSVSATLLKRLAESPPAHFRFLIGYAGWGPGQLAAEFVSGSWLYAKAQPALVFDTSAERMWEQSLRSIGVDPAMLATTEGVN